METGFGRLHPPPSSPTKPQISRPTQNRPFLWGFQAISFCPFGLRCPLPSLGLILASRLCIQKFRSPQSQGPSGTRESWEFLGPKRTFGARSVLISGSIRGLRTAGSILPEHHEVARRQYRVANDLRLQRARDPVQGTRVRLSC
jgi:hypothetical protein